MATVRSSLASSLLPDEAAEVVVTAVRDAAQVTDLAVVHLTDRAQVNFPLVSGDLASVVVGEAQPITLSDLATGEVVAKPVKIVTATRVSNESLEDTDPALAAMLGESIGASLAAKLDQIALGSVPDPAPAGLGRLTGFTSAGSTSLTDVDAFHRGISAVREAGAQPTSIIVSTATALRLVTMRESGSADARRSLLQPDPTSPTSLSIGGVPIVVSRHVADTAAYVVPRDRLRVVLRKQAAIELDRSAFALTRETLVVGEIRASFVVLQPAAVAKITVSPAA